VSAYAINKVCWLANRDDQFRQRLMVDPERTLQRFVPALKEDERAALLRGDIGALVAFGANRYLLAALGRRRLFGLDRDRYTERLRTACQHSAAVRDALYPGLSHQQAEQARPVKGR
jgi:hypothetical protein